MSARTDDRQHFPPDGRLIGLLLIVVATLYLTVSTLTLLTLGFNYEETGGTVFDKVHPATFFAAATLLLAGSMQGNPLPALLGAIRSYPGTAVFVAAIGVMIADSILVVGMPFTAFFDTFLAPVIIFFLYKDMRDERAIRFVWLVHSLMLLNAVIGIGEYVTGERLTPIVVGGVAVDDEWRSSALLGHPLANASLTGAYLLCLALGGGRDLPKPLVAVGFIANAAAMIVFGGRASSVILLAMLAALAAKGAFRILRGSRVDTSAILTALVILPIAAFAVIWLEEAGFFAQFISRFVDDNGSASTRVEMFELFHHLSWYELLLAPDAGQVNTLKSLYGLDYGIESFWVSFVLNYGVVPGLAFFAALFLFCRDIVRTLRPGAIWAFAFFFLVASTSVSLSSKSTLFAVFLLLLLVMLRRPQMQAQTQAQAATRLSKRRVSTIAGARA